MNNIENLKNIPLEELVDIQSIKINCELSKEERIIDYIKQIKNPYCYKYKNHRIIVQFDESENAKTLEEQLQTYIANF